MMLKIFAGVGILALLIAVAKTPAVVTDLGTTVHDVVNMFSR